MTPDQWPGTCGQSGATDFGAENASLTSKLGVLYGSIQEIANELGNALMDAAAILAEVR